MHELTDGTGYLAERWAAETPAVTPIRHAVIGFARASGADAHLIDEIALAVTEAAANAVVHGYPAGAPAGTITVEGSVDDGWLRLSVTDDGAGMSASVGRHGLGMGLAIIADLADEVKIGAGPRGGTRVAMGFSLMPS